MMQVLELKKLKPLINPSLSLLTRSVSGTAKGKGKVKAGQTLKRSVVTTKKGKSPEGEVDPEEKGRGREKDEMARTLEGCLSATSPVRYMKPKEAEREAERERMGLVSKARTKELEMFKKNKNKESEFDSPMLMVGVLREKDEMAKTLEGSLSATSPVRYMKPKEAEREAEREKMGLVSKERTKELEMLEKSKNSKYEFDSPMLLGTPGFDLISLGLVDAEAIPKYELTVEDGQRLAKEYSRVLMRKHRARQTAESAFLNLKKEAIEALPEGLKAAALVPDLAPFPKNRFMATLTPPIEGYIEKINEAARQTTRKAKLR